MTNIGFYPGSFDPVTFGHIDIIARSARLFDLLVIGVGVHHGKKPVFDGQERVDMLENEVRSIASDTGKSIEIITFDDLTVDAARRARANTIVRGLRDSGDFDYEMQMAGMNSAMANNVETIFLAASPKVRHISAKFVRQIAAMGGDVTPFVPEAVAKRLSMIGEM